MLWLTIVFMIVNDFMADNDIMITNDFDLSI